MTLALPANPLPTLADEILAVVIEHREGVKLKSLTSTIGADIAHIRRAAKELNVAARAILMRRRSSREFFLVPNKSQVDGLRVCVSCGTPFDPPFWATPSGRKKFYPRRSCSRACGIAWSWSRPGVREKRSAGIKVTKNTPEAMERLAEHNKRRWSKPSEHEKLAEQNRREWADPVKATLRAQSIKAIHTQPEKRKHASDTKKRQWAEPGYRTKTVEGIRRSKTTPEARAQFSKLLADRWKDPVMRAKYTAANARRSHDVAARNKGKKQSPGQVAKRVASTRATKQKRHSEGARA